MSAVSKQEQRDEEQNVKEERKVKGARDPGDGDEEVDIDSQH